MNLPIGPMWRPYDYNIPPASLTFTGLATPALLTPRLTLDALSWFVCTAISSHMTVGDMRLTIRRNTDSFMNTGIRSRLITGQINAAAASAGDPGNRLPYYLPAPLVCSPNAILGVDASNLAGAANIGRLTFHGALFLGSRAQLVEALKGWTNARGEFIEFFAYQGLRAYVANEREKLDVFIEGTFDFLLTQLQGDATGRFESRIQLSGNVPFDDNFVSDENRYGSGQYPGFIHPWMLQGGSTIINTITDLTGLANTVEIVYAGMRYPRIV